MEGARKPSKIPAKKRVKAPITRSTVRQPSASEDANSIAEDPVFTTRQNGEKGANVHTVHEKDRIRYTKMLLDMRENDNVNKIEMPADLTNTERKYIHLLAAQLGLKSKSSGKDGERRITISKRAEINTNISQLDDSTFPSLKLSASEILTLEGHLRTFPPTQLEHDESLLTGSSIISGVVSELSDEDEDVYPNDEIIDKLNDIPMNKARSNLNLELRVKSHHKAQTAKLKKLQYKEILALRANLPAYAYREEICRIVRHNSILIITGETGCGKSTQVPQFLLDDPLIGPTANIVITQPRRISATSVAERIAYERCEQVGSVVGYNVRLESLSSRNTQLLFVTPGVLLRKFLSSPQLDEYSHVIIDEIHERDKHTEFLMIALRNLLEIRVDLKIIMMSATIQTNELLEYWCGFGCDHAKSTHGHIPRNNIPAEVCIPGRTFPVQEFFLEDILSITGYEKLLREENELQRIETQMQDLLRRGRTNDNRQNSRAAIVNPDSLFCLLCGQSNFKCPEELGAHLGLCDGNGKSPVELEECIRIRSSTIFNSYDDRLMTTDDNVTICKDDDETDFKDADDLMLDEPPDGLMSIWNGESPLISADVMARTRSTLTEEELLRRYQSSHDDEQIDDQLILQVIEFINQSSYGDGAVLVFLPGWQEISELILLLENTPPFSNKARFLILPLHSGIPSGEQKKVFLRPPHGVRKVILATNIAETSLTIDDVAFVVDSGRAKEKSYDPHLNTSTLQPVWISQASAKQRRGRAGRTRAGVVFRLYSRRRYESFRAFLESEIIRTPLEELCLQCKRLGLANGGEVDNDGIPAFLAAALTPPHPKSVMNALELLIDIGAMQPETNDLTVLGHILSSLSLEPRVGKMVIWSYLLGVARAASSMAVAMSYKTPFILPPQSMARHADQAKVMLSEGSESDQITVLNILSKYDTGYNRFGSFCRSNFINEPTIRVIADLRKLSCRELVCLGFPDPSESSGWQNRNEKKNCSIAFLQAAIAAGLHPNIALRFSGETNFCTMKNQKAKIHVSSVNACKGQPLSTKSQVGKDSVEFIAFGELVRGSTSFTMSQTSYLSSALPLILICGKLRVRPAVTNGKESTSVLSLDDWVMFSVDQTQAAAMVILRSRLNSAFWSFIANPARGIDKLSAVERSAIDTLTVLIESAFKEASR